MLFAIDITQMRRKNTSIMRLDMPMLDTTEDSINEARSHQGFTLNEERHLTKPKHE
jgi:hypothetical protein